MNTARLVADLAAELDEGGLRGSFLVRDLHTGREVGIEPDLAFPLASLIKVPLAAVTLDRIRRGELSGSDVLEVRPGRDATPGGTGTTRFRHPAWVALDDLLSLALTISDNLAADTLFGLTPPAEVTRALRDWGLRGITARHLVDDLARTPEERFEPDRAHLAHSLAIGAATAGRGHHIPQLDVTRANSGSARAFADLLQALWTESTIPDQVAARVREMMAANLIRHRLAPDFTSDAASWASKTGTVLNLRHEAGVVEHADGRTFAVVALTESHIPAVRQPEAEALMARVARLLHDHLRW